MTGCKVVVCDDRLTGREWGEYGPAFWLCTGVTLFDTCKSGKCLEVRQLPAIVT